MGASMTRKDFIDWTNLKNLIQNTRTRPKGYTEGEVWWASIGINVGFEEDGKGVEYNRPVLIIKGFSKELFWAFPLSTTKNRGKYYYPFELKGKTSVALLSQLRVLDTLRLNKRIGVIKSNDLLEIRVLVHKILG